MNRETYMDGKDQPFEGCKWRIAWSSNRWKYFRTKRGAEDWGKGKLDTVLQKYYPGIDDFDNETKILKKLGLIQSPQKSLDIVKVSKAAKQAWNESKGNAILAIKILRKMMPELGLSEAHDAISVGRFYEKDL